jgi:geranylgeranylglycerol-phosphate geranylgeranyltransferase
MRAPSRRAVSAALRLVRWANALIAAAGVCIGAWWAGWGDASAIGLTALAAVGLTAAANVWNDMADVDIDRVAHPERPLVIGDLSLDNADRIAIFAATGAVVCASNVSVVLGVASVAVLLVMRLYSPWLKRVGLVGNLVVSVLASLPFVYGSYAAGHWARGLPLVLIAIPFHLARELAKDLDDRDADRGARRTIPLTVGVQTARIAIVIALAASGVALAYGLAPLVRSHARLLLALTPAMLALTFATACTLRGRPGSPAFFKLAMVCAMAALLVARA